MSCCTVTSSPFQYSIPSPERIAVLKRNLKVISDDPVFRAYLALTQSKPEYHEVFTPCEIGTRVMYIALFIFFITAAVLTLTGHFWTLPQDFMDWIHTLNPVNTGIGGGIATILIAGASWVIHQAHTNEDQLLKRDRGAFKDIGSHLESVFVTYSKEPSKPKTDGCCTTQSEEEKEDNGEKLSTLNCYIDKSTITGEGHEKAYLFYIKAPEDHYFVSTLVTLLGTPVYLVGTIVYNLLRTAIIPFYILVQYVREKCVGHAVTNSMAPGKISKRLYSERSFELLDIPKEMIKSIIRVLQAPFYALAYSMAGFYSLFKPMEGRKLAQAIERDWNRNWDQNWDLKEVSFAKGYWSVGGEQELFKCEGGGGPLGLGGTGFYLAGCWQPVGIAEYENGVFKRAYYLPKAIDPTAGVDYTLEWRSNKPQLESYANANQAKLESLLSQMKQISAELALVAFK